MQSAGEGPTINNKMYGEEYLLVDYLNPRPFPLGRLRDADEDPSEVVWSNHNDYFAPDAKSGRLPIDEAIPLGSEGLGAFFASGADPHFQYIEFKKRRNQNHPSTCGGSWLKPRGIAFAEGDLFFRTRFEQVDGKWQAVREEIPFEESMAYFLTDNRLKNVDREVIKAEFLEPVTTSCQSSDDLQKLHRAVDRLYISSIEEIENRLAAYDAVDGAFEEASRGWNVTVTLPPELAGPVLSALQEKVNSMPQELAKRHQQLSEALKRVREILEKDGNYYDDDSYAVYYSAKVIMEMEINPLGKTDLEVFQKEMDKFSKALLHIHGMYGPAEQALTSFYNATVKPLQKSTLSWMEDYRLAVWALSQFQKSSGDSRSIDLKMCRQYVECVTRESSGENRWIEGEEVIHFAKAFYYVVLPMIEDRSQKESVRVEVEAALRGAGNLESVPISRLSRETSDLIRTLIQSKMREQAEAMPQIYQEVSKMRELAQAIPVPQDLDPGELPPLPTPESSPGSLLETTRDLISFVRAKIPMEGPSEGVRRFMEDQLLPLHRTLEALAPYYSSMVATHRYLETQSEGEIQLRALGGLQQRGGFLPELDEVVIDLPTMPLENGVSISMEGIAAIDTERVEVLKRDLEVLARDWKKRGLMAIPYPRLPKGRKVAQIRYGTRLVPLKAAGEVQLERAPENLAKALQEAMDNVSDKKMFGERYFAALAQQGVLEVIVAPHDYFEQSMRAQASALAREATKLISSDPQRALKFFKAAATKFGYVPSGLYEGRQKRILLNAASLDRMEEGNIQKLFLHENGHADETSRRFSPERLGKINAAQNTFIPTDPNTVSDHPEVLARSEQAAEERRADGYIWMLKDPEHLKEMDPDLFNYFQTLNRYYENRRVERKETTHDENGWREPQGKVEIDNLDRLIFRRPFDPAAGNLSAWVSEHPHLQMGLVECLSQAADGNQWRKTWEKGCELYGESRKK